MTLATSDRKLGLGHVIKLTVSLVLCDLGKTVDVLVPEHLRCGDGLTKQLAHLDDHAVPVDAPRPTRSTIWRGPKGRKKEGPSDGVGAQPFAWAVYSVA